MKLLRCAYCSAAYLRSTFPVWIEACCVDCLPNHGWPATFHVLSTRSTRGCTVSVP